MFSRLTDEEKEKIDMIVGAAADEKLGLMRCRFQERDMAVLITAHDDGGDDVVVVPWALVIDETLLKQITPMKGTDHPECGHGE